MQTEFQKRPPNLVLVVAAGVGKTHLASALYYQAVQQDHLTVFTALYDFTAKLAKARNVYHMIVLRQGAGAVPGRARVCRAAQG